MKPGWFSSESHLAALAIANLSYLLHQHSWPSVNCACAAGVAWVSHAYIAHRTRLKIAHAAAAQPAPGIVEQMLAWIRSRVAALLQSIHKPPAPPAAKVAPPTPPPRNP